jgi:DNA-binding response OmpR family regulator
MKSKRILIIDDDDAAVFGYTCYLSKSGYTVVSADCLTEGLRKIEAEEFDAVVFDICLPDGNSLEVIPKVRAKNTLLKILVISGLSDERTAQAAIDSGADGFLVKPLSIGELCTGITSTLENN